MRYDRCIYFDSLPQQCIRGNVLVIFPRVHTLTHSISFGSNALRSIGVYQLSRASVESNLLAKRLVSKMTSH